MMCRVREVPARCAEPTGVARGSGGSGSGRRQQLGHPSISDLCSLRAPRLVPAPLQNGEPCSSATGCPARAWQHGPPPHRALFFLPRSAGGMRVAWQTCGRISSLGQTSRSGWPWSTWPTTSSRTGELAATARRAAAAARWAAVHGCGVRLRALLPSVALMLGPPPWGHLTPLQPPRAVLHAIITPLPQLPSPPPIPPSPPLLEPRPLHADPPLTPPSPHPPLLQPQEGPRVCLGVLPGAAPRAAAHDGQGR